MSSISVYLGFSGAAIALAGMAAYVMAYRYVRKYRNIFKEMGLPYVKRDGWTGVFNDYIESGNFFEVEKNLVRDYGKMFGMFEGRQPCIMISDPELIRQVLLKDFDSFSDRRLIAKIRSRPVDFAMTNLTGQRWRHVRQQTTPAFTPNALKRMQPLILNTVRQFKTNLAKKAANNDDVDVKAFCGCFTMDVVASVAFGMDLDSMNHPDNPFVTNARLAFQQEVTKGGLKYVVSLVLMFPSFLNLLAKITPDSAALMKPFVFFQNVVTEEMERRRKLTGKGERPDFLQMVMHLEKDPNDPQYADQREIDEYGLPWLNSGLTTNEIVGQAMLFFLAGYETTANVLSLTLFALASHPECQQKLFEEIEAVFPNPSQDVTYEGLHEMKYLDMCINETMRIYTPLSRLERTCVRETSLGGYRIPEEMVILIPINVIHSDPDLWEDPEKFDPDRFASELASPVAFLPFGLGNRNCIGMRLAQLELKMALVSLIREFKFDVSESTELPLTWKPNALRMSAKPILLKVKHR